MSDCLMWARPTIGQLAASTHDWTSICVAIRPPTQHGSAGKTSNKDALAPGQDSLPRLSCAHQIRPSSSPSPFTKKHNTQPGFNDRYQLKPSVTVVGTYLSRRVEVMYFTSTDCYKLCK
jgi:hypothetical protein